MKSTKSFSLLILGLATILTTAPVGYAARTTPDPSTVSQDSTSADTTDSSHSLYDDLMQKAVRDSGMFVVHRLDKDFYFEIPDSLLGRDILIVNKVSGVPAELNDAGLNKGMNYENKMIRFHQDTLQKKVWVTTFDPRITAPEEDAISRSVRDNYRESVFEYFPIETYNQDSSSLIVKVNKVFDGSEKSFNNLFDNIGLQGTSVKRDLSKIETIKSFPSNIVVRSLLSAQHTEAGGRLPLSLDVTTNLVLLPREPMKPRFADDRVGLFTTAHLYYRDNQQKAEEREFVNRWRLEPRPEDVERYKRGELVEPAKPIVFYIDPSTPPQWVPYIMKGIVEWQVAFEAAGFKNAIQAREVSADDPDFDIDDVNYSAITYAASEQANAMGPSVVDPRSGEIIEADVIWWHNVMSLLHAWIRVQTGAVDPGARGNTLSEADMGNAIRFVSSHEVGHSLGLKHNMGASYSVPVDSLRSKSFTDNGGGTASSIMDYARFNYVAQPEDSVTALYPVIGTYDKHAIRWAYTWLDTDSPYEELPTLNGWLREHENDPAYWYGEQSSEGIDPRSQSEDLGDDAVEASLYGLKNLKRIVPRIVDWTASEGELHYDAGRLLMAVVSQWKMYADHVKMNIGGFYLNNIVAGQTGERYVPVPADMQRKAMRYLLDEVCTVPEWLFDAPVWRTSYALRDSPVGLIEYAPYNLARNLQYDILYWLLDDARLQRMFETEALLGRDEAYTVEEMLGDLTEALFAKTRAGKNLSLYERMTQKNYLDALIVSSNKTMEKTTKRGGLHAVCTDGCTLMMRAPEVVPELETPERPGDQIQTNRSYSQMNRTSETASAKRGEMERILRMIERRRNSGDTATQNHYTDLILRIREALQIQ